MQRLLAFLIAVILACWTLPAPGADEIWHQLPAPRKLPDPSTSGYAWVNGIQLYYATYGTGEPLLLLHGPLGNSDYWGNQVPAFARKYRVIIIDSRGHGRSTRDNHLYSYRLLASDVLALLDLLHIDKVSIVGWSDGGNIGLQLAIHHPERLRKLFVFDANFNPSGFRSDVDESDTFIRYVEQAGRDYQRLSATPEDYWYFFQAVNLMWGAEPNFTIQQLGRIRMPVMIAAGAHDEAIKSDHTAQLARSIPGAKLLILPDAGFFAIWQQPKRFNKAVLDFLEDHAKIAVGP